MTNSLNDVCSKDHKKEKDQKNKLLKIEKIKVKPEN